MIYALDTNIIIGILNFSEIIIQRRNEAVTAGARFIISPIVDYEMRRGFIYKPSPKKESIYMALTGYYGIGLMSEEMWIRSAGIYAELRKKGLTVNDADIFIAAFCIVNGYTLVTANLKDFENIEGLQYINWYNPIS